MTTTQQALSLRACDVNYAELIDGRYARSLKELPGPQVALWVDCGRGFWAWLDDLVFASRVDDWRGK